MSWSIRRINGFDASNAVGGEIGLLRMYDEIGLLWM